MLIFSSGESGGKPEVGLTLVLGDKATSESSDLSASASLMILELDYRFLGS